MEKKLETIQSSCPKGCKGLTYTHDDRITKSCCQCCHEWEYLPVNYSPYKNYQTV